MEIDFLIAKNKITSRHNISPIEVKSSTGFTTVSLEKCLKKYATHLAQAYIVHTGDVELDGDYLYTIQEDDGTGRISVRIPRQKQADLLLEFWDKDDHLKRFSTPIGLYLFAAGYDPDALDLSDYEIHIDFRQALLYLRVADWTETRVFALYDMKKP